MASLISVKTLGTGNNNSEDSHSIASRFGSFGDFQSQTELCPNHKSKGKDVERHENNDTTSDKNSRIANSQEKRYTGIKKYGGMLLTLAASFFFSVVILFVKILKDYNFDAYGVSFWRFVGIIVPTIPMLLFYECGPGSKKQQETGGSVFDTVWPVFKNDNWKSWIGLLFRGLIGSSAVILRYYALQYLSIGDTSVITYSTPVLVTVMAHFFLGEKCGIVPVIIAFTTLAGVIIVTKPPLLTGAESFDTGTLIGTGLACGSLLCSSVIIILTRMIREVHFALMTLVIGTIGLAQATILSQAFGTFSLPEGLYDFLLLVGVAGFSFLGLMSSILALKFEQAGPVALIRSCDVIFGFLFQFIFLNIVPDVYSSIGAVIVLSGVLVTAWRKYLTTLPEKDSKRSTWSWIMM